MAVLPTSPALPVPGRQFRAVFTLQQPGATEIRVWCTQAPEGSALDLELKKQTASSPRVSVYSGPGGPDAPWVAMLDKGGEYILRCREVQVGEAFSGGYQGDPRGAPIERPLPNGELATETVLKLYVGQRTTFTLGTNGETATLVVWAWDNAIRHTSLAEHGELTPCVQDGTTDRAKQAASSVNATVRASITDGMPVAMTDTILTGTLLGDLPDYVTRIAALMQGHFLTGTPVHVVADGSNAPPNELKGATLQGLPGVVGTLLRQLRQHLTNDYGPGPGSAKGTDTPDPWHVMSGNSVSDQVDLPLTQGLSGVPDAYMALADLAFSLERHVVNTDVHVTPGSPPIPDMPPLLAVAKQFIRYLTLLNPPPAPGDTIAATVLRAHGGSVA